MSALGAASAQMKFGPMITQKKGQRKQTTAICGTSKMRGTLAKRSDPACSQFHHPVTLVDTVYKVCGVNNDPYENCRYELLLCVK